MSSCGLFLLCLTGRHNLPFNETDARKASKVLHFPCPTLISCYGTALLYHWEKSRALPGIRLGDSVLGVGRGVWIAATFPSLRWLRLELKIIRL